jgi:hypothetical protein
MPPGPGAGPGISYEKLPGKKQVLWSDEKLPGKKNVIWGEERLAGKKKPKTSYEKLAGPINPDSLDQKKAKVDRTLSGKNKNVDYAPDNVFQRAAGTAGHALDPISGQPMVKGSPVEAQSNSPAAQFGRRLGTALDLGFDRPGGPGGPKVSKQKLAGKKKPAIKKKR